MSNTVVKANPTNLDVDRLIKAFGHPKPGTQFTHDEITAIIGSGRKTSRYQTIVQVWRHYMLRTFNVELGSLHGVGYRVLNDQERVSAGITGVTVGTRRIVRSVTRANLVDTDDPKLRRSQDALMKLGAATEFAMNRMSKSVQMPSAVVALPQRSAPSSASQ